jgi:hypothetical protein
VLPNEPREKVLIPTLREVVHMIFNPALVRHGIIIVSHVLVDQQSPTRLCVGVAQANNISVHALFLQFANPILRPRPLEVIAVFSPTRLVRFLSASSSKLRLYELLLCAKWGGSGAKFKERLH